MRVDCFVQFLGKAQKVSKLLQSKVEEYQSGQESFEFVKWGYYQMIKSLHIQLSKSFHITVSKYESHF